MSMSRAPVPSRKASPRKCGCAPCLSEVFPARVVRIGIESDRVSEERRVYVKCEQCPVRFHLGEQAEVLITVATLPKARLVPETAVTGYDGTKGTVWTVENGRLKRRVVSFGHRTEDARLRDQGRPSRWRRGRHSRSAPSLQEGRAARAVQEATPMNLAYRDVRHNLFRFLLTCFGLSLLLGVVLAMIGIYRGIVVDALTVARNHGVDLWVVEAGSRGPFAEASRIPGDSREAIARLAGVTAAGSVTYQTVEAEQLGRKIRLYVIGFEPGRPGGPDAHRRRPRDWSEPFRDGGRSSRRAWSWATASSSGEPPSASSA